MNIRTRIAPSPTGEPHVGTAYMALFNLCFARHYNGKFILRVEDTDKCRYISESETKIFNSLNWLGLNWDEGPDIGGSYGPYRQSERINIYKKYINKLIDTSHAFPCFCSNDRLKIIRINQLSNKQTPKYDGYCLNLSKKEVSSLMNDRKSFVIRMKIPSTGNCIFNDMLRGDVCIPWDRMDMQILLKSDGYPTYFLANVVDDYLMGITHVLRGEEWLASTPKLIKLYEYFEWKCPKFCHMPLLLNKDKTKLSKRNNNTSIFLYERLGFLPQALVNYLGTLGWSMPDERVKFSIFDMIKNFDISRISLGGSVFDQKKLAWLNGQWIRDNSIKDFTKIVNNWIINLDIIKIAQHVQHRIDYLSQIANLTNFFFTDNIPLDIKIFKEYKKLTIEEIMTILKLILFQFQNLYQWKKTNIKGCIKSVIDSLKGKCKCTFPDIMPILFLVITGKKSSISVLSAMEILGKDISCYRIQKALDLIHS